MKKSLKYLQIFRFLVQIASLIFLSGLFTLTFSGIKKTYTGIFKGNLNFTTVSTSLIMPLFILLFTLLLGRFFCGWFCAFGTFNDLIYTFSKKVFKLKFRVNSKLDSVLKYVKYLVLGSIVYFIWTAGNNSLGSYNPWDAFAQLPQVFSGGLGDYALGLIVLALIAFGAMFIERFFCRYLCPLGAVFSMLSLGRLTSINKPTSNCGKCTLCSYNCAMGINLSKSEKVRSKECIWCMKCIEGCPKRNANTNIVAFDIKAGYFALIATILFLELYRVDKQFASFAAQTAVVEQNNAISPDSSSINPNYSAVDGNPPQNSSSDTPAAQPNTGITSSVSSPALKSSNSGSVTQPKTTTGGTSTTKSGSGGTATYNSNASTQSSVPTQPVQTNNIYNDGTYTGYGRGHGGTMKVAVTVSHDKITNIKIISQHETYGYFEEPFSIIPEEIISSQSTDVDGVSGATHSSNGLISAVDNALEQARI